MPDQEYYWYYKSTRWDNPKCDENIQTDATTKNIFDTTTANNEKHVSFLSQNDYSTIITGKYSMNGPYNIYQIEREINILTKDLSEIMMEINTCSNKEYYDDNGVFNQSSNGKDNCRNYTHLVNDNAVDFWGLKSTYRQFVPNNNYGKKTLCQQYHDLKNLVSNFNSILGRIETKNIITPPTPIPQQVLNNSNLRDEIEKKLDNIYSNADSRELDSVRMLDSTVYTSVLWTVLATSVIFFMFKKM